MAHSSPGYSNRSAEDGLLIAGIIAVLLGGFAWLAWFLFHRQIAAGVIGIQHWQMGWIGHVTNRYAFLDAQVLATDPAGVKLGQLWRLLHNVGAFFRWPAAALVLVLALACLLYNAPSQFTRHLDLQGLMREHARTFRASSAYVERGLALVKPADGDGPAGPAQPLAFSPEALARADAVLTDVTLVAPCAAVAAAHGFTAPAMMSVLTLARSQAGVLAPAAFNALKLVDRRLWYALHSLGFPGGQNPAEQPNPRIEAVGARDHWAAERDAGQPLPVPSLARALAVVRKAVDQAAGPTPEPETAA